MRDFPQLSLVFSSYKIKRKITGCSRSIGTIYPPRRVQLQEIHIRSLVYLRVSDNENATVFYQWQTH